MALFHFMPGRISAGAVSVYDIHCLVAQVAASGCMGGVYAK